MRIAAGPAGSASDKIVHVLIDRFAADKDKIRFELVSTGGPKESAEAMSKGSADLAVLPSTVGDSPSWPVVAIMRQNVMALMVPTAAGRRRSGEERNTRAGEETSGRAREERKAGRQDRQRRQGGQSCRRQNGQGRQERQKQQDRQRARTARLTMTATPAPPAAIPKPPTPPPPTSPINSTRSPSSPASASAS